ncbi:hypothetical protein ES707_11011 [subsurface metagenome]
MNYDKADTAFSKYVRLRDSKDGIATCISCRTRDHWSKMTVGHFIKRRHKTTRLYEKNGNTQCWDCNRREESDKNLSTKMRHAEGLIKKYGPGIIAELTQVRNSGEKFMQHDIDRIEKHYKERALELEAA